MAAVLARRMSRRAAFRGAALGTAGLAAAIALGCGGEEEEKPAAGTPAATGTPAAAQPKPGGTLHIPLIGDAPTIDPQKNLSFRTNYLAGYVYSRLYKFKTAPGFDATLMEPVPDVAASHEVPDLQTWVFKLRPDVKFHNLPPVNGRQLTSEDVALTFRRFRELPAQNRAQLGMVESVTTPDAQTVVFKLTYPYAPFLATVASPSYLWLLPKELIESKFGGAEAGEAAKVMVGSGPWILEDRRPDVGYKFRKNPDYFLKGLPYVDFVDYPIITSLATMLAQFQAKSLDLFAPTATDVPTIKQTMPDAQIEPTEAGTVLSFFYFNLEQPDNPMRDPRLRRAVSLALDREGVVDTAHNVGPLKKAGFPVEVRYHTVIPSVFKKWWIDPTSADMGPAREWFQYDVQKAKALLSEAGYTGQPIEFHWTNNAYGDVFNSTAEAHISMLRAAGFNLDVKAEDYRAQYITQTFLGRFSGMAYGLQTPFTEVDEYLFSMLHSSSVRNHGHVKDAELDKLVEAQRAEANEEKRKKIIADIQRYVGDRMYYVPASYGSASGWGAAQPWVKNWGDKGYRSYGYGFATEYYIHLWLDKQA